MDRHVYNGPRMQNAERNIAATVDTGIDTSEMGTVGVKGELLPLSPTGLISLTIGLLGLQFCWAVQVGNATKTLLELGLSARLVSYAWLAGPIAGIVVQPLVGAWSDRCTSPLGRRRPFLISGTIVTVLCLILFSHARQLGEMLGDSATVRPFALSVAIASFWALDFALNAAQGPLRALLADIVPASQHSEGNSYFALMTGLGNLAGSLSGAIQLTFYFPFFRDDLVALYSLAAIALALTMTITVIRTRENALDVQPGTYIDMDGTNNAGTLSTLLDAWRNAPVPFHAVFSIQCATWFAWFTLYVFGTSWVGKNVYGGRAEAAPGTSSRDLYDAGVRAGNFGLALQSAVTVAISLLIPHALHVLGTRTVYVGSHAILGVALLAALWTTNRTIAVILLAITGVPWAVTMALPWSLMGKGVSRRAPGKEGVYFTLFNLSQCFPEVVVSVVSPAILNFAHSQAAVLGAGGAVALLGGFGVLCLRIGDHHDEFERVSSEDM